MVMFNSYVSLPEGTFSSQHWAMELTPNLGLLAQN
jgi:hypothetical protein